MGARTEALARQFEATADEATAVLSRLSDPDWRKTTAAEQWPVGVVAHHVAVAHPMFAELAQQLAAGQAIPPLTMDMVHAMNAQHAREHHGCTKTETIALHKTNAAAAAALVRGIDDAALERRGTILAGMPPLSVEQLINGPVSLVAHVNEHLASIRATTGS